MQPHNPVIGTVPAGGTAMVKRTSFESARLPGRAIAGRARRLVVAADHPRRVLGPAPLQRIPEETRCAKNILTVRLRALVDQGILDRARLRRQRLSGICADAEGTRRVSDPRGAAAMERGVFLPRRRVSTRLVDRANGRPVRKLELHAQDGRLLGEGDTS